MPLIIRLFPTSAVCLARFPFVRFTNLLRIDCEPLACCLGGIWRKQRLLICQLFSCAVLIVRFTFFSPSRYRLLSVEGRTEPLRSGTPNGAGGAHGPRQHPNDQGQSALSALIDAKANLTTKFIPLSGLSDCLVKFCVHKL